MKTTEVEQLILLKQSGEIGREQQVQLDKALLRPENQKISTIFEFIVEYAKTKTTEELNDLTKERIMRAGKDELSKNAQTNKIRRWISPFLAAAALALLLSGVFLFNALNSKENEYTRFVASVIKPADSNRRDGARSYRDEAEGIDQQIEHIHEMLAEASADFSTEDWSLEEIAEELLWFEEEHI